MTLSNDRAGEHGNVLFYILIAVVAFAALSFAVSQSSRESASTINNEKADLAATELLDYVTALRSAVQNMAIQGVKQNQICFDNVLFGADYYYTACDTAKNKVFSNNGGNAPAPRKVANDILQTSLAGSPNYAIWSFPNGIQVKAVGQDCAGNAACNDLMAMVEPLSDTVCKNINRKMGVSVPETIPTNLTPITSSPYKGSFTIGTEITAANLVGKRTGCFRNNDGHNVFYAVLIGN